MNVSLLRCYTWFFSVDENRFQSTGIGCLSVSKPYWKGNNFTCIFSTSHKFYSFETKDVFFIVEDSKALVVFIKESNLFCFVGIPASDNANQIDAGPGPKVPEPAQQDAGARAAVRLPGERVWPTVFPKWWVDPPHKNTYRYRAGQWTI